MAPEAAKAPAFLPAAGSDYDGWQLDQETAAVCPDCDQSSDEEFRDVGELLTWIDGHLKTCTPPE